MIKQFELWKKTTTTGCVYEIKTELLKSKGDKNRTVF